MLQRIRVACVNGLTFKDFSKDIFSIYGLDTSFEIINDQSNPDVIVFGPYGNNIPQKGNYVRVGYFCENFKPDMSICEWGFGTQRMEEVKHPNYFRIQWHGIDPNTLIKPDNIDVESILQQKSKFCNFLYSHHVPYREHFFTQLSKYKKVDAPGNSMNNTPSIDSQYQGDIWEIKRQFLKPYKFTIAFENYQYLGYQTEKLYDAMRTNSLPIYCGDPLIHDVFNTKSFINVSEFYSSRKKRITDRVEPQLQANFKDIRFDQYNSLHYKIKRKVKAIGRNTKMKFLVDKKVINDVIEYIIEIDKDDKLYLNMLQEPWLKENKVILISEAQDRWIKIFKEALYQNSI